MVDNICIDIPLLYDFRNMMLYGLGSVQGGLDPASAERLRVFDAAIMDIIHVDDFDFDAFSRPAV